MIFGVLFTVVLLNELAIFLLLDARLVLGILLLFGLREECAIAVGWIEKM